MSFGKGLVFLMILSAAQAYAASFTSGESPMAVSYSGEIEVHCKPEKPRDPTWARYFCRENTLEPDVRSYFFHRTRVRADHVELLNRGPESEILARFQGPFNYEKSRSDRQVNLWYLSRVDRPFLRFGLNTIDYTLRFRGQVVEQGRFLVDTRWGGERRCLNQIFLNRNPSDCRNPENLCPRYFWTSKDCR